MPIKIKIGDTPTTEESIPQASISLAVTKTLDGNLLVNNHQYMDILIVPEQNKIVTMAKPYAERDVYEYQRDLMYALFKGGVTAPESPRGTGRFGIIEVKYPKSKDVNALQAVLFQISEFLKRTRYEDYVAAEYDENIEDRFTDPGPDDSTAYGEFPPVQDTPKGQQVVDPTYSYAGYGYLF